MDKFIGKWSATFSVIFAIASCVGFLTTLNNNVIHLTAKADNLDRELREFIKDQLDKQNEDENRLIILETTLNEMRHRDGKQNIKP